LAQNVFWGLQEKFPMQPQHAPHGDHTNADDCRDACTTCAQMCTHSLFHHCLTAGGQHVQPDHVRLMVDCAAICETAAGFMTRGSPLHAAVCRACAAVCRACADSCRQLDDMEACVEACERCEAACRTMIQPAA